MSISVIIISWNNRSDLRDCLISLEAQSDKNFEVIVIDNHSSDGSAELVKNDFPKITIEVMNSNLGFSEGCNRGIAVASGDWICTLNSDTTVDSDWIKHIRLFIRNADPSVGMLQSKVLFKKNSNRINSTGILLLATGSSGDRDFNATVNRSDAVEEIFVPSACAAVYRKDMLLDAELESGFFDRSFFMYTEDLDLGWRCRLMGWKAYYLPKAMVLHSYQGSSQKRGDKFADLQCRKNRIRALLKNGSIFFIITTLPKTIYDLFVGLRYSGLTVFTEFYKAVRDGLDQRNSVTKILTIPRRKIEKTWVTAAIRISRRED